METKKCDGKMVFDTQKEAINSARVAEFQHGSKLKTYFCRECSLWHLASDYGVKHDD